MRTAAEIARDNNTITYSAGIAPPVAGSRYDCAWLDHPPATYNPLMQLTWCRCGMVRQPGNHGSNNGDWYLPPMSQPPAPWVFGMDSNPGGVPDSHRAGGRELAGHIWDQYPEPINPARIQLPDLDPERPSGPAIATHRYGA